MALRGFVLCADGRYYHRVLCEDVLRAAEAKDARRERTAAATRARQRKDDPETTPPGGEKPSLFNEAAERDDDRYDQRNDSRDDRRDETVTVATVRRCLSRGQHPVLPTIHKGDYASLLARHIDTPCKCFATTHLKRPLNYDTQMYAQRPNQRLYDCKITTG